MAKKLVIGVGGTGLDVLRCLRRRIIQDHPEKGLAQFPRLGFLYIDTDPNAVVISDDNRKRWEVMGKSMELSPNEYIVIQAPAIGTVLENLPDYPQLRDWLPTEQLNGLSTSAKEKEGAQQIRALGRMIFTLRSDDVRRRVASSLDLLPDDPVHGETEIYLACSLSGGTGGGMFLDIAYSLRRWTNDRAKIIGCLVMPDLNQEAGRGPRYVANAYGALMDLNYFSLDKRIVNGRAQPIVFTLPAEGTQIVEKNPFDVCYLLGPRNQAGVQLSLSSVPDMISHRLYLGLDSAIESDVASMMNNGAMQRGKVLSDPVNGNLFSQAFSTFGLSTIQYPTEEIVEIVSNRLAHALVLSWSEAPPVDDVADRVKQRLPDLGLIDDVFLGNRDVFQGANDHPAIPNDVERQLNALLAKLPGDNRAQELSRINSNFLDEFRGGLRQFYRGREENIDGAVQVLVRKVRAFATDAIVDMDLGLPFSRAAVEELIRLLEFKQQELTNRRGVLAPKVKNSRTAVEASIGQVTIAENVILRKESKVKEALTKVKANMTFSLVSQVEEQALEYGSKLVGKLVQGLTALRTEIGEWASAMSNVRTQLAREVSRRAESLEALQNSSSQFNGAILFKSENVDAVYGSLDTREALQYMRDQIARRGEVLKLGQSVEEAAQLLFRMASDWLIRVSSVRLAMKNVADQLVEDFPGEESVERRQVIANTYRRSAVFLEFDQNEAERLKGIEGHAYEFLPTTATERSALMDDDGKRFRNVGVVRKDIIKATPLRDDAVKTISDTHQIIFISERTGFPLRVVRDVHTLREAYRAHAGQKSGLPLHIQRDYNPPLGDLLLVSQSEVERQRRAEADFLTGWTLGWIRPEINRIENRDEVRYRFTDRGAEQYETVGVDREAALAYFTGESTDTASSRRRLTEAADRHAEGLTTYAARAEFAKMLATVLDQFKADIPYGEESKLYQRYNGIRQYIVELRRLPEDVDTTGSARASTVAPSPGGRTGSAPTPAAGPEADFARYVGLMARQFKGQLGEHTRQALRSRQQILNISDERAEAIVAQVLAEFAPQPSPLSQYRQSVELFMSPTGELSEEGLIELVNLQDEYGIDVDVAQGIHQDVRAARRGAGLVQ